MTKLDTLIKKLCPNGVEFKTLGEVTNMCRGASPRPIGNYLTTAKDGVNWIKIGDVKVGSKYITQTEEKITLEGAKKSRLVKKGDFVLSNSMSFGRPYILAIDGYIHDGWLAISNFQKSLLPDFLYHLLSSSVIQKEFSQKAAKGGSVQNLNTDIVKKLKIPVPPLEVQKEIVQILDKFTELEAELEGELEARIKQYEYYRSKLLSFNELGVGGGYNWVSLGEIGKYSKSRIAAKELDNKSYVAVDNLLQNKKGKTISSYVPTTGKLTGYEVDDILIGNIRPYLKKIWRATNIGGTNGDVLVVRINEKDKNEVSSSFLYHSLASDNFFNFNMQFAKGTKMPRGDKSAILKYKIYIPPMEEQQRIVSILDKFEKLVNNISEGLPAELSARRTQYEYYRSKLLTFKQAA